MFKFFWRTWTTSCLDSFFFLLKLFSLNNFLNSSSESEKGETNNVRYYNAYERATLGPLPELTPFSLCCPFYFLCCSSRMPKVCIQVEWMLLQYKLHKRALAFETNTSLCFLCFGFTFFELSHFQLVSFRIFQNVNKHTFILLPTFCSNISSNLQMVSGLFTKIFDFPNPNSAGSICSFALRVIKSTNWKKLNETSTTHLFASFLFRWRRRLIHNRCKSVQEHVIVMSKDIHLERMLFHL